MTGLLDRDHFPDNWLDRTDDLRRRVAELERPRAAETGDAPAAVAEGDLLYADAGVSWAVLSLGGASGSVLTRGAADPAWSGYYLAGTAGKTLTFSASLTLAGADGKTLTLTTSLTNNTGAGTLTWPARLRTDFISQPAIG